MLTAIPATAVSQQGVAPDSTPAGGRAAAPGEALRVLDLPYLPQSVALCGGAAAAMVQRYWGEETAEPTDFAGLVRPDEGGIRTDELTAELHERGWRARRLAGELEVVADQVRGGRPVMLLLEVAPDRYHYVVVVAVTEASVLVHDPARAPFLRLDREELLRRWEAAGRWALLLLPPAEEDPAPRPAADTARRGAAGAAPSDTAGAGAADDAVSGRPDRVRPDPSAPCAAEVEAAVAAARAGRTGRADSLLTVARRRCPDRARVHAELAGVRFLEERWEEAAERARTALSLEPGDDHALRILAASRYLAGEEEAALRAWNRLGEPRLVGLRVYGLRSTRYEPLRRHLGMPAGRLLTPGSLAAARRRAGSLPAVRTSRVALRAPAGGRAELEVAVLERPELPTTPAALAPVAARALTDREARVRLGSLAGAGERWTAGVRWWDGRERVGGSIAAPGAFGVPGVWTAAGSWERETFAVRAPGVGPETDGPGGTAAVREQRSRATLDFSRWVTGSLRLEAGAALDRRDEVGTRMALGAGAELRGPRDRLALRAGARGWEGAGPAFGSLAVAAAARTEPGGSWRLRGRAGLEAASAEAPRTEWPGAGTGRARPHLLRAHPLLEEGAIAGPAFGRVLAHAGLAVDRALPAVGPLSPRLGAFLDLARPWETGGIGTPRFQADLGIGVALGVPGAAGRLRLDYARGLRDGAEALTLRWASAWPGW